MTKKYTEVTTVEDIVYTAGYRRIIFKGSLLGSMFLTVFSLIDFFYTELYLDATIEAIGCVILLSIAYVENKRGVNSLAVIFGLIVISTVIGSGAFSNHVEESGIVWFALIPFLSFFLLGEKLGLRVSLLISTVYIAGLINIVIQYPEKGFTTSAIFGVTGALFCSILLSIAYEKNRTSMIHLLSKQAKTDSLTSLLNRRGLMISFEKLLLLSQQDKKDLYLLILDLDNFKLINDNFGHDIGDIVIKETANAAKTYLKDIDRIARIGGEEFVAVLSNVSSEEALKIAERIRRAIENLEIEVPSGPPLQVTVSIGVTKSTENKKLFSDFFKIADKALYEAKNNGRNRIVFKEDN
ncbi:GGDEF domain-containing protein [Marinomonas colpomeniae]|uniref:diguanylate cyclase n=1 Tax=Marinomonas colpomeniae TaxID=2774408 RepID=A0ABR8P4C5_9GAMM|nr:GGDEF domain-containing protein [Marinomonas colpomeniae]MBD5771637.1 GGDEF domain-containing protein [Marinomonas colpomeniae]